MKDFPWAGVHHRMPQFYFPPPLPRAAVNIHTCLYVMANITVSSEHTFQEYAQSTTKNGGAEEGGVLRDALALLLEGVPEAAPVDGGPRRVGYCLPCLIRNLAALRQRNDPWSRS